MVILGFSEDMEPAEELKILQDKQLYALVFFTISVGVFVYLAKSFVQLAQAVNVTDEWYTYVRIMAILMVGSLLISMSTWLILEADATVETQKATGAVGNSVNSIFIIASAIVQLIIAGFVLKNGLGNLIFKVFVAIIGVLSVADLVDIIVIRTEDSDLGFITWIGWAIAVVGIGVLGLRTKEA
jgi:surface polysaccharide O-acyltransferase-like enzyme